MNGKRILGAAMRLLGLTWTTAGIGVIALTIFFAVARHTVDFSNRQAVNEFTGWLGLLLIVTAPGVGFWLAGRALAGDSAKPSSVGATDTSKPHSRSLSSWRVTSGVAGAVLMASAGFVIAFWLLPMFGVIWGMTANWWATAVFAALGSICGLLVARR